MKRIRNKSALAISILLPIAIGSLSAYFSGNMPKYAMMNLPKASPPAYIFPIVWTILYILMGISAYIIRYSDDKGRSAALKLYMVQLCVNFLWNPIFFGMSQYLLAFIWLIGLIMLVTAMIYYFCKISPIAGYIQLPYLLWCYFAAYLNYMVYRLN